MATFSKRHYEAIANVLCTEAQSLTMTDELMQWRRMVDSFGDKLALDNPRFDRDRFLEACGCAPGSRLR